MNIFSLFENWYETLLLSMIVYYLVFNFVTQKTIPSLDSILIILQ